MKYYQYIGGITGIVDVTLFKIYPQNADGDMFIDDVGDRRPIYWFLKKKSIKEIDFSHYFGLLTETA